MDNAELQAEALVGQPAAERVAGRTAGCVPQWEREPGGGWDFTVDSLDRLEELIRAWFVSCEEARKAEDSPFLSVAAWYFDEVQNRNAGTLWQCRPEVDRPHV
ncbi:hypothetical protein ACFW1M_39360 [Streptomyces inhibens]|uniref:hypothetical protein n=1 Tax=Streptomyces inhibens TaxID=2293571 RepID=UPI0036818082